jgi:VIT1/CCC1 family predicted Fe2+/Mn2+ transporter
LVVFWSGVVRVLWKGLGFLFAAILGIVLFLYGANYYNAGWGWAGVYLFVGVIVAYSAERVYEALRRRRG